MGIDGIGPKLLKNCALALYVPIHHLFLLSITNHTIPSEWKCHSITPIHKSGDSSQVTNYRPISLLCVISKVLERIVFDHLSKFIINNNILVDSQFGFRPHHSTAQQLLLFLSKVHNILNCNASCDVIYLDFQKAFDSVSHSELLVKLWNVGITSNLWLWIKEYLSNRHQQVCINGCYSSSLPVISGVPQGSILGPLLFLVYINDLPQQVLHSDILLFADDTKILKSISSVPDSSLLQQDLNNISNWCLKWKLSFNESKCLIISFHSKSPSHPTSAYSINGHTISTNFQHKDLGIVMCSDCSWSAHISSITSQAYKKLGLLRRFLCSSNSISTKKMLYLSLVRSQLMYCSQVWRPSKAKDIKIIEDVQRRATKFILNDYSSDYRTRLCKLHILPLTMLYELNDICFFVKSLKQPHRSFAITDHVSFSTNNTRSGLHHKLVQPRAATNRSKHFYFNRLPRLWNSLPPIDTSRNYESLVSHIKMVFWDHFISNFDPSNSCTFHFCCPCTKCHDITKPSFKSSSMTTSL